jgi:hypothetical protein
VPGTPDARRIGMNANTMKWAPLLGVLGLVVSCGASQQSAALPSQEPVPGTRSTDGVTAQQGIAYEDVVERIAAARCDRDQSCNRIGPGAAYRDRDDCLTQTRAMVAGDLNPIRCPGGVGEVAVDRCVNALEAGQCDSPGQTMGRTSLCHLSSLCMKR